MYFSMSGKPCEQLYYLQYLGIIYVAVTALKFQSTFF